MAAEAGGRGTAEARSTREDRAAIVCLAALTVIGLALAWRFRFVQDDAFIAFDYARALARGEGLTWFGARVEGYVDFGWILWIALCIRLGFDPIAASWFGGLVAFVVAVHATWRLAGRVFDDLAPRAVAVLLFVTNFSVVAYATGGLETMLQTALLAVAVCGTTDLVGPAPASRARLALLSATFGLAVLVRVDSALPSAWLFACALVLLARRGRLGGAAMLALGVPAALLVSPWVAWKLAYYGALLPNVFHIKVGNAGGTFENGLLYVGRFLHWYLVWPALALGAVSWLATRSFRATAARGAALVPAVGVLLSWLAYVVCVGGDFMEFRLIVLVTPYLFILVVFLLDAPRAHSPALRSARLAIAPLFLWIGGWRHATGFEGMTSDKTLDSVPALADFYGLYRDGDWSLVGRALGRELAGTGAVIATSACGAIPYYSELKTVDMCGLTDAEVARHGNRAGPEYRRPGHRVAATQRYLAEARVNLIIGHPLAVPRGSLAATGFEPFWRDVVLGMAFLHERRVDGATLVAMPVTAGSSLVMWYFTRHPAIDAKLASGAWEQRRVIVGE